MEGKKKRKQKNENNSARKKEKNNVGGRGCVVVSADFFVYKTDSVKRATGKWRMCVCHWDDSWKNLTLFHSTPSITTVQQKELLLAQIKRDERQRVIHL